MRFTSETGAQAGRKGGSILAARPGYLKTLAKRGGENTQKKRRACKHEWAPNTTMNFMRCEKCGELEQKIGKEAKCWT